MKGLAHWFKSSNKMKRWIFLILVGMIFVCYGIAKILITKEISFIDVGKIVFIFVLGFLGIVFGLIFLNKRTMEVIIESTDDRLANNKNVNINSLIFNKTVYDKGPNIVAIGGGTGLNTVLAGMKEFTNNLTAIVNITDYGEELESRKDLDSMPLDDVKGSIISLANNSSEMYKLFNSKLKNGHSKEIIFSDVFFSAMKEVSNGDFADSIVKSNEVLNIIGKVLPATLDEMKISAELENGYVVEEKSKIAEVVADKFTKINRVTINPSNCKPAPGVIEAIKNADCIIIGPGSLYTNVIPNLLIGGINKAIKESSAIKVYISNIMTEPGQTDNYSVSDHLNAIIEHCGQKIVDYCIYDTGEIVPEFIKKYNLEGQDIVEQNIEKIKGIKFLQRNLSMISDSYIRHDPSLVANSIIELICDDLKYQDKQSDPQYLMLNNKLKEDKRINKIKKEMAKKEAKGKSGKPKHQARGQSKFSNKYSDRIASIRESDERAKKKLEKEKIKKKQNKKKVQKDEEKNTTVKRKSARGLKKKTPQQIREEMLKTIEKDLQKRSKK